MPGLDAVDVGASSAAAEDVVEDDIEGYTDKLAIEEGVDANLDRLLLLGSVGLG